MGNASGGGEAGMGHWRWRRQGRRVVGVPAVGCDERPRWRRVGAPWPWGKPMRERPGRRRPRGVPAAQACILAAGVGAEGRRQLQQAVRAAVVGWGVRVDRGRPAEQRAPPPSQRSTAPPRQAPRRRGRGRGRPVQAHLQRSAERSPGRHSRPRCCRQHVHRPVSGCPSPAASPRMALYAARPDLA